MQRKVKWIEWEFSGKPCCGEEKLTFEGIEVLGIREIDGIQCEMRKQIQGKWEIRWDLKKKFKMIVE